MVQLWLLKIFKRLVILPLLIFNIAFWLYIASEKEGCSVRSSFGPSNWPRRKGDSAKVLQASLNSASSFWLLIDCEEFSGDLVAYDFYCSALEGSVRIS
jgi:hypothetical protein